MKATLARVRHQDELALHMIGAARSLVTRERAQHAGVASVSWHEVCRYAATVALCVAA